MPAHDTSPISTPHETSSHTVRGLDGSRIHCVVAGSGPTVLLAHGYLLEHGVFDSIVHELASSGYRAIAFDQRDHARSFAGSSGHGAAAAASDYAALLEHFDVRDGILVGHSMGAFLGLVFCLRHPQLARARLRRLVLLGPNAGAVARGSLQNRLQTPILRSGVMPRLWRVPPVGRVLVKSLFGRSPDPEHVEQTRQILARADVARSLPLLDAMNHEDYYGALSEITLETHVICGELDRTCPPWHSQRLGAELPNATNRWLPNVGHMLSYEAPFAVLDAIRAA